MPRDHNRVEEFFVRCSKQNRIKIDIERIKRPCLAIAIAATSTVHTAKEGRYGHCCTTARLKETRNVPKHTQTHTQGRENLHEMCEDRSPTRQRRAQIVHADLFELGLGAAVDGAGVVGVGRRRLEEVGPSKKKKANRDRCLCAVFFIGE